VNSKNIRQVSIVAVTITLIATSACLAISGHESSAGTAAFFAFMAWCAI
jgi:hypothetical protein